MKSPIRAITVVLLIALSLFAQAKRPPSFEFKDLSGKNQKVSDLRGSIVVVNFWATWCGPCREELPLLAKLSKEYSAKKIRFVAVSADNARDRAKVDKFLAATPIDMDVWLGADLTTLDRANLGNELPATLIVDEQGEVVARILGQAREEDLRRPLDWLVNGKSGAPPEPVVKHY